VNFKTTLILLVLTAAAGGVVLLVSSLGPPEPPDASDLPDALISGRAFETVSIRRGDDRIELRHDDGRWWIVEPWRFPADGEAVGALINAGLALSPRSVVAPPRTADDAGVELSSAPESGLDPPLATVGFVSDEGTFVLELGHTTVAGTGLIRVAGTDETYRVDDALHTAVLEADPRRFRDPLLPNLEATQVSQIEVTRDRRTHSLRREADAWSLTRGDESVRADAGQAIRLAQIAQQAQPLRFVDLNEADLAAYGLQPPVARIRVADAAGRQRTLRLGQSADLPGQTVYASWSDTQAESPVVFTLPAAYAQATQIDPEQLRDRRLVVSDVAAIRGMRVNRVGRDVIEVKLDRDGRFGFVKPEPNYQPDDELLTDWVRTLHRADPVGFARAPREAQAPVAVVELRLAGGRTEHVRVYADRDGREDKLLAARESETTALVLPRAQLAPLLAPVITLRNRNLPTGGTIESVRLQRDDGQVFLFEHQEDRWSLADAEASDWEDEAFQQLLDWLEAPRVESWTAMPELPRGPIARLSLGQDRPAYVVNVEQGLGQRTDLPGVFRLPPGTTALFRGEYRPRLLLPFKARQIEEVKLHPPSATVADEGPGANSDSPIITRDSQGILKVNGQAAADPAMAAGLLDTLAGLQAKRYRPAPESPPSPPTSGDGWRFEIRTRGDGSFILQRDANGLWRLDQRSFFLAEDTDTKLIEAAETLTR
jgi:hypothetical protein